MIETDGKIIRLLFAFMMLVAVSLKSYGRGIITNEGGRRIKTYEVDERNNVNSRNYDVGSCFFSNDDTTIS